MTTSRIAPLTILLLSGMIRIPTGRAQPEGAHQDAVRAAVQARKHYAHGEYRRAIQGFERAFRIVKRASLLFNIADCHERLGAYAQAVAYYQRYLAVCTPDKRAQVHRLIAAIRARPSSLKIVTRPPGAAVWLNGSALPQVTPLLISVPPGPVRLRLMRAGFQAHTETLQARLGQPLSVTLTLAKKQASDGFVPVWKRSAGFVGLDGGLKKSIYRGVDQQPQVNWSLVITGGWGLYLNARARLELGGRMFLSTIGGDHILTLLDVSALVGARITLHKRLFLALRGGVGLATILDVKYNSFFFNGAYNVNDAVPSSYLSLHLWASLGLGYRIWRSLSLVLTPVAIDFIPPVGHLKEDAGALSAIFRYNLHLGLLLDL